MATAPSADSLFAQLTKPFRSQKKATSITPTYNAQAPERILTLPLYRERLDVLYDTRLSKTTQDLLQDLFKNDPDVSAAVGSYLTLSDTPLTMLVHNYEGQIDAQATATLGKLVRALTRPTDYTQGFQIKTSLPMLCQELRYMLLLRGGIAGELVFDKNLIPSRIQQVDFKTLEFFETEPGKYKPRQKVSGKSEGVPLDIPSFFVAFHRRDPTKIYPTSDFVSVINTVAARQQIINDLYRIMQVTGFPRIALKVVEEVLMKSAPASVKDNPDNLAAWANGQLAGVANSFATLRADQAFAHFDSLEPSVINEKNPAAGLDVKQVIDVLNAQNQSALKTMATVIGRGDGSVGVASAEVRIAAMNADQLNVPLKQFLDQLLTFLINSYGIQGFVETRFASAELRPDLELEPQKMLRQSRLLKALSLGLISDEEYHLQAHGRLPPTGAAVLMGTGFDNKGAEVRTDDVSSNANGGSLGRSLTPEGGEAAKSNGV
ncbi:MAG: hypothetical protein ACK4FG_01845 [Brevundimonas sp.]